MSVLRQFFRALDTVRKHTESWEHRNKFWSAGSAKTRGSSHRSCSSLWNRTENAWNTRLTASGENASRRKCNECIVYILFILAVYMCIKDCPEIDVTCCALLTLLQLNQVRRKKWNSLPHSWFNISVLPWPQVLIAPLFDRFIGFVNGRIQQRTTRVCVLFSHSREHRRSPCCHSSSSAYKDVPHVITKPAELFKLVGTQSNHPWIWFTLPTVQMTKRCSHWVLDLHIISKKGDRRVRHSSSLIG